MAYKEEGSGKLTLLALAAGGLWWWNKQYPGRLSTYWQWVKAKMSPASLGNPTNFQVSPIYATSERPSEARVLDSAGYTVVSKTLQNLRGGLSPQEEVLFEAVRESESVPPRRFGQDPYDRMESIKSGGDFVTAATLAS
ncbi:unnamed protein product, partial [marine sediment metagenome]